MLTRQRQNESIQNLQAPSDNPASENLDSLREAGESFFQAGDDAINRALSGDSLAFLSATRQEGGQ
jgi:hypothetical protein